MKSSLVEFFKKNKVSLILSLVFSICSFVLFFATINRTFEKLYYTETFLPYLISVFVFIPLLLFLINTIFVKSKIFNIIILVLGLIFCLAEFILLAFCISKLTYFFMAGTPYFFMALLVIAIVCILIFSKFTKKTKTIITICLSPVFIIAIIIGVFNVRPVYFDTGAVVFAVEDEYQICWSTSTTTTGYITIGEEKYTDNVAGSLVSSRIHKVTVPREKLENEKKYTVFSSGVILNRAYFARTSKTIQKKYNFRPVDTTDGLQIYSFSDNHLITNGAVNASSFWGDKLDILVANGDHLNDVSSEWQIRNLYSTISRITNSSIPVIITRGNHEAVGTKLNELPRFFGSRDNTFYYTVKFDNTLFIILDVANDMADTNSTIKATADFTRYREEEFEWLKGFVDSKAYEDSSIKNIIGICHMAFPISLKSYHDDTFSKILDLTNEMGMELLVSGHSHKIAYFEPNIEPNEANYPVILDSIRNDNDFNHESASLNRFTGTAIEINNDRMIIQFTNSKKQVLDSKIIDKK